MCQRLAIAFMTGLLFFLSLMCGTARAVEPPDLFSYQGVLRDSGNAPLDGDHDMVFRFFSAGAGGEEILIDNHTAAVGHRVPVTGGLFNVQLGSGLVSDGSGPGSYRRLSEVFAAYSAVFVSIEVGGETLSPRVRIVSSPYSANASRLEGNRSDHFVDTTPDEQSKLGKLILGQSSGTMGSFALEAYGEIAAAYFKNTVDSGFAYLGDGHVGVSAQGDVSGGYFRDSNNGGYAYVGHAAHGISAYGDTAGGFFLDTDSNSQTYIAHGGHGVTAWGTLAGGFFNDVNNSGYARVGDGEFGISAYGDGGGGFFQDTNSSGSAFLGDGHYGLSAYGDTAGAYLADPSATGYAYVGYGDDGIAAGGHHSGGRFFDTDSSGNANIGIEEDGIRAWGHNAGGYFQDSMQGGLAYVGYGDRGIWGKGNFAGGTFSHRDGVTVWADVAQERSGTTYKIRGTGEVSFVQNHPFQKDQVVVYAAPEGDEVAVYTRGQARLSGGEARIKLGETFAWVANPDVGLTAHLTPRSDAIPLAVLELSTGELVVRGPDNSDAVFDYLVYGLRIGFEKHAPVQMKEREAFLPRRGASEEFFAEHPELEQFNPLQRFRSMQVALGKSGEIDLDQTELLVAAIDQNREAVIAKALAEEAAEQARIAPPKIEPRASNDSSSVPAVSGASPPPAERSPSPVFEVAGSDPTEATPDEKIWLPVAEPVEAGDLLVLDPVQPGTLRRAASVADPHVVGVASGPSRNSSDGQIEAPMADSRYAKVKADAGYGAILPGDLLVTSPTPGHAMRALEMTPGTILGKAIDPLESGMGSIRILLVTR